MPKAIVDRLAAEIASVQEMREFKDALVREGGEVSKLDPETFGKLMADEIVKWEKVVRGGNIKAE